MFDPKTYVRKYFDSKTKFYVFGNTIKLYYCSIYMAEGSYLHWCSFFEDFYLAEGDRFRFRICRTLEGHWFPEDQSIVILDPSLVDEHLTIFQRDLSRLESRFLDAKPTEIEGLERPWSTSEELS